MNKQAEFVVIGSGGAGMAAAVTAMHNGVKNIVVLEKSNFIGGNSRMAGGQLYVADIEDQGTNNPLADDVFRETMAFHHYERVEPKILRAFLDGSRDTVRFLERIGIAYQPDGRSMMDGKYPFGNFYRAIKRMEQLLMEGGNQVVRNTAATRILLDENREVTGVECKTSTGESYVIGAKAVAITTGGFTGNSELLHKYFPYDYDDLFYTDALPLQGDGIALAESAGAALTPYCTIVKENGYSCDSRLDAPNRAANQPCSIWINAYGERFLDESNTMGNEVTNALVRQPGMIGYAIFSDATLTALAENPLGVSDAGSMLHMMGINPAEMTNEKLKKLGLATMFDLRPQLEKEYARKEGWVEKASTIWELAKKIKVDAEQLQKTVDEYNAYCVNGRDGLFAKAPQYLIPLEGGPFYALKFRPILIDTVGPIVVNERMQVLNPAHKSIPGLYAAGMITSGSQGKDYHLHGAALTYSLTSGRILGKSVTEQLQA